MKFKKHYSVVTILFLLAFLKGFGTTNSKLRQLVEKAKESSTSNQKEFFSVAKQALKEARLNNDSESVAEINIYFGYFYYYTRNLKEAKKYFNNAKRISDKLPKSYANLLAKIRLVYMQRENGYLELVEDELNELKQIALKNLDLNNLLEIYNFIGILKEDQNRIEDATKTYLEGLKLAEKNNLPYFVGVFKNNLGLLKFDSGLLKESMIDFKEGYIAALNSKNKRLLNHIKLNVGIYFILNNKNDTAQKILRDVLNEGRENRLPLEYGTAFLNIAYAYFEENKITNALIYYDSAIYVFKKNILLDQLNKAIIGKCRMLLTINSINEIPTLFNELEINLKKTGNLEDKINFMEAKSKYFQLKGYYKESSSLYKTIIEFKDSLNKLKQDKSINELLIKYKTQNKEIELEKEKLKSINLEKENLESKHIRNIILTISSVVVLLIIFVSLFLYNRKLNLKTTQFGRELLVAIDNERSRLARDLHDDLGPLLSLTKSKVVRLSKVNSELTIVSNELTDIIEKTRTLSRELYPSIIETLGIEGGLTEILNKVEENTSIYCNLELNDNLEHMDLKVKTHVFRILQECINNTIKHSNATALKISSEKIEKYMRVIYQDNGKGLNFEDNVKGIGLRSIKERANIIFANIQMSSKEKGFKLILDIPIVSYEG
jgi:signal transduction histidine kinase